MRRKESRQGVGTLKDLKWTASTLDKVPKYRIKIPSFVDYYTESFNEIYSCITFRPSCLCTNYADFLRVSAGAGPWFLWLSNFSTLSWCPIPCGLQGRRGNAELVRGQLSLQYTNYPFWEGGRRGPRVTCPINASNQIKKSLSLPTKQNFLWRSQALSVGAPNR